MGELLDFIVNHGRSAFCLACFITLWIWMVMFAIPSVDFKWRSKDKEK